jgi:hypothetical protein
MRTTVTLDDKVYEVAKALPKASGKSLGQILSELARRELSPSMRTVEKNGLPLFKVVSEAAIIPSSRAKELLAEDPL